MLRNSEPFTVGDVVTAGSLKAAIENLVLAHPDVAKLRKAGKKEGGAFQREFYDYGGLVDDGRYLALRHFEYREPLMSEQEFNEHANSDSPLAKLMFERGRGESATRAFHREIVSRAQTFFGMLSSGRVVAIGHNAQGFQPEPISSAVWSHRDFSVSLFTGDVFEAVTDRGLPPAKRWTAIALQAGAAAQLREAAKREAAAARSALCIGIFESRARDRAVNASASPAVSPSSTVCRRPPRAPKLEAFMSAIMKEGLFPDQRGLPDKEIAGMIWPQIEHLYPSARTRDEYAQEAERKMVRRALNELQKNAAAGKVVTLGRSTRLKK